MARNNKKKKATVNNSAAPVTVATDSSTASASKDKEKVTDGNRDVVRQLILDTPVTGPSKQASPRKMDDANSNEKQVPDPMCSKES